MSTTAQKAILKAIIDGIITELMIKTTGEQVYLDANTTLSAKIAEIVLAINARAKTEDVNAQILALKQELLGDLPVEAYNTFTELAAYISDHKEVADALTEAIGNKAEKSVVESIQQTITGLGTLAKKSTVTENDLAPELKEKVNAASEGNHAHQNKALLDSYDQTNDNIKDAVSKKHSHANSAVLDGITAEKVTGWNSAHANEHTHSNKGTLDGITAEKVNDWNAAAAKMHSHANGAVLDGITADSVKSWNGKGRVIAAESQPADLAGGDLWIQLV